jgi:hypothetical protein
MTEPEQSQQPAAPSEAPVHLAPLRYFEARSEPWIPVVIALSWTVAVIYGTYAAAWIVDAACDLGQNALNLPSRVLRPETMYTQLPAAIGSAVMAYSAFGCLRFRESHRSTLVSAARLMLVIAPLTDVVLGIQLVNRIGMFRDPLGAISYGCRYGLAGVANMVVPLLVIAMFNRTEVRSLFR